MKLRKGGETPPALAVETTALRTDEPERTRPRQGVAELGFAFQPVHISNCRHLWRDAYVTTSERVRVGRRRAAACDKSLPLEERPKAEC